MSELRIIDSIDELDSIAPEEGVYRPEFYVLDGSPALWYTNAQRGSAYEMAVDAQRRYYNWSLCGGWRVVPAETPEKQPVLDEHLNKILLAVPE